MCAEAVVATSTAAPRMATASQPLLRIHDPSRSLTGSLRRATLPKGPAPGPGCRLLLGVRRERLESLELEAEQLGQAAPRHHVLEHLERPAVALVLRRRLLW